MSKKRGRKAIVIEMTQRHIDILSKERNKHSSSAQLCRRIDIILLAYSEQTNICIANKLRISRKTVRDWRMRWVANYSNLQRFEKGKDGEGVSDLELRRYILGLIKDAPRIGTPKKITPAQEQQIVALACDQPVQHGVEITNWTHEMLAKTAIAKNIVPTISSSQIGRILKNKPTSTAEV